MSDVFDEISDDLRREKLNQFWKENGSWIIGGVITAILLTAGLSFWQQLQYKRNAAATAELTQLVTDISGDKEQVKKADLSKLEHFSGAADKNHAAMARFMMAYTHIERGEKEQAVELFETIAKTSGIDKTYRDLAKVLSITQRLNDGDAEKLKKELSALTDGKNTWRYTALELEALLDARENHMQEAVDALTKITADPSAPEAARNRAMSLRELYTAEKVDPKT